MKKSNQVKGKKSLWSPARIAGTIVVLSLFAAFGISSCSSSDEKRESPPPVVRNNPPSQPAAPAPAAPGPMVALPVSITDTELRAVTGAPIKLSNYSGKVYLVNLWATWCGPCRLETPELVKLYKEFRPQGFEIVGLSTENPEVSADSVREFVHNFDVNYRIGWATPEVAITLMQGKDAIPQSFVISRNGRIVRRFVGFNPMDTPGQIRTAIQEALNDKTTAD